MFIGDFGCFGWWKCFLLWNIRKYMWNEYSVVMNMFVMIVKYVKFEFGRCDSFIVLMIEFFE